MLVARRPLALQSRANLSLHQKYQQQMPQHGDTAKKLARESFLLCNTPPSVHNSSNLDDCQVFNRLRSARPHLVKFVAEKHRPIPRQVNTREGSTSSKREYSRTVPSPMCVRVKALNTDLRLDPEVNRANVILGKATLNWTREIQRWQDGQKLLLE
jgi:hypothetical protein